MTCSLRSFGHIVTSSDGGGGMSSTSGTTGGPVDGTEESLFLTVSECLDEVEYQREHRVAGVFLSFYGVFIFLIIVGNGLVIWLVLSKKKLRTTTNFFVVSLCISDISVALFTIPMEIASHFSDNGLTTVTCRLIEYFVHTSLCANIYCVVAITIDRYRSVMHPFTYKLNVKISYCILAFFWVMSFGYAGRVIPLYSVAEEFHMDESGWSSFIFCRLASNSTAHIDIYVLVDFFITYFIPLMAISFMYVKILHRVVYQRRLVSPTDQIGAKKKRLLRMLVLIVGLFAVCQLPIHVYKLRRYWGPRFPGYLVVLQACDVISFSNSWFNVLVYAFLNDNIKAECLGVFCCKQPHPPRTGNGGTTLGRREGEAATEGAPKSTVAAASSPATARTETEGEATFSVTGNGHRTRIFPPLRAWTVSSEA